MYENSSKKLASELYTAYLKGDIASAGTTGLL